MDIQQRTSFVRRSLQRVLVLVGAASLTTLCFLVLPLIQAITATPVPDTLLTSVDTGNVPPPPSTPEPEPEPEDEQEEPEPELDESSQPLDLAQMELVLNPGGGTGGFGGQMPVDLKSLVSGSGAMDDMLDMTVDQKPRPIYQPAPVLSAKLRKIKSGATVNVRIIVDVNGKVKSVQVESSTDPRFDKAVISAIKKWKYEPGKRRGKPSEYRLRKPITFPKQG